MAPGSRGPVRRARDLASRTAGSAAPCWTLTADGSVRALGTCLDAAGGTKVQLYACNGTGGQRWSYDPTTHDVVNTAAGTCPDVTGNSPADGTRAQIWTCTGGADRKWTRQPS